jgi:hypothetical protein
MKSLAQIEPRTPISSVPFTIITPGSYYLTTNVTSTANLTINIAVSGVTLDLNGFTISSTVANAANGGTAILLTSGLSDITIFNGHIRSGVTNNSSGVFSGAGFSSGIFYSGLIEPVNTRVSGVSFAGCLTNGIYLGTDDSTLVEACTVRTMGSVGIKASIIKNCVALDCGSYGIYGDQVSDSRGDAIGSYGLFALRAQNCFGSSKNSTGLNAAEIAIECRGSSTSGTGLSAYIANSCLGSSSSGTAQSITFKYNMP